jgi:hypothetical protein
MDASSMESTVTLRQAYMVMFEFLRREWRRRDKPDALGALLGNLALWDDSNGNGTPIDAAVFPAWLECANNVLEHERGAPGYAGADIRLT